MIVKVDPRHFYDSRPVLPDVVALHLSTPDYLDAVASTLCRWGQFEFQGRVLRVVMAEVFPAYLDGAGEGDDLESNLVVVLVAAEQDGSLTTLYFE